MSLLLARLNPVDNDCEDIALFLLQRFGKGTHRINQRALILPASVDDRDQGRAEVPRNLHIEVEFEGCRTPL